PGGRVGAPRRSGSRGDPGAASRGCSRPPCRARPASSSRRTARARARGDAPRRRPGVRRATARWRVRGGPRGRRMPSASASAHIPSGGHPPRAEQGLAEFARYAWIGAGELALGARERNARQDVANDVQPRLVLVVGAHQYPRRMLLMGAQQHAVARPAVIAPVSLRRFVDRADLPLLERIAAARTQSPRLLLAADVEVILEERDSRAHQHALEAWSGIQELVALRAGAELHDVLDAGAVIPTAVEEDDLAGCRQVPDVALEVPLGVFAIARLAGSHDPHLARAQVRHDALDRAVLAGGVAPLEDHEQLAAVRDHVTMQLDQLDLQAAQLPRVFLLADPRCGLALARTLARLHGSSGVMGPAACGSRSKRLAVRAGAPAEP